MYLPKIQRKKQATRICRPGDLRMTSCILYSEIRLPNLSVRSQLFQNFGPNAVAPFPENINVPYFAKLECLGLDFNPFLAGRGEQAHDVFNVGQGCNFIIAGVHKGNWRLELSKPVLLHTVTKFIFYIAGA